MSKPYRIEYGVVWKNDNGDLHRLDGPAKDMDVGYQEWYKDGVKHREGGPAVICKSYKRWYYEGMIHRLDGPAIQDSRGYQWWFKGHHYLTIDNDGCGVFHWNCYDYDCEEEWFEVIPEELKINYLFYGHSIPD